MFNNGRKTIAAFISQVTSDFQELLCKGITARATELDYNVIFFTNQGGYGQNLYDAGELYIAEVPYFEKLDGIILAPDTYSLEGLEDRLKIRIKEEAHCPVVSVRLEREDYYNVLVDNNTVIEKLIRHFIEDHGFTRLNFLAGPKGVKDSEERLESYRRILSEYNIPIEEERIYYGDYWRHKPYEAVNYWVNSDLPLPEAIICANDYMAIATTNALHEKGIKVPDQVAISGCDDISGAADWIPSITTARIPMYQMGMEAVDKIARIHQGEDEPQNSYLDTIPMYRDSCCCDKGNQEEGREQRRYYNSRFNQLEKEVNHSGYMSADLTGLTRIEDINKRLRYYVYENEGFTDFYLCLYPGWQDIREDSSKTYHLDSKHIQMELGIKMGVDYSRINFDRTFLFPTEFMEDKPMVYYVTILHHQNNVFGYSAIQFNENKTYMLTYQLWMINVGNAFESVRMHRELNRLIYKLEDMYIRDDLTGLYNRRALEQLGENYLKQAQEENATIMVLSADLDNLKMINDQYGHASGDIAIKEVANALQHAADDDEICMRCGGDEFTVIGLYYDDSKMSRFVKKFIQHLAEYNKNSNHSFQVQVSYGWSLIVPDSGTTVEECMVIADKRMYQQKAEKRAKTISRF